MKTIHMHIISVLAATLLLACAHAKPFDYHPGTEIPEGPGVFSKEKGSFTVYDSDKSKKQSSETTSDNSATGMNAAPTVAPSTEETNEFQQFKKWKEEQKAYEAFQQWKQSPQNAAEYQEFQEWKRWKAYQEWQKSKKNPQ